MSAIWFKRYYVDAHVNTHTQAHTDMIPQVYLSVSQTESCMFVQYGIQTSWCNNGIRKYPDKHKCVLIA
jgi:hypothetical protein